MKAAARSKFMDTITEKFDHPLGSLAGSASNAENEDDQLKNLEYLLDESMSDSVSSNSENTVYL